MVRSIVIPADGDASLRIRELAGIDQFQEIVGGWLEPIQVEALSATIYCNESAHTWHEPLNSRATALWWYFSSGAEPRRFLLGDVILAGIDDGLTGADAPEDLVEMLLGDHRFVVQGSHRPRDGWRDTFARFDCLFDAALWCLLIGALADPAIFRIQVEIADGEPVRSHLFGSERSW